MACARWSTWPNVVAPRSTTRLVKHWRRGPPRSRAPAPQKKPQNRPKGADTPKPATPLAVAAIRLLVLTGCREGEILSLRWDAVDLERGFLRLADTKTGKNVRPLGAAAAEVLGRLPRLQGSPFVFPGARRSVHLKDLKRLWYAVRHAAGLEELRIHALRHPFAPGSAIASRFCAGITVI